MADLAAYQASTPDWARLRDYARRVARDTKLPLAAAVFHQPQLGVYYGPGDGIGRSSSSGGLFGLFKKAPPPQPSPPSPVAVIGQHWLLEQRTQHIRDVRRGGGTETEETTHYTFRWALLPNGDLVRSWLEVEEVESRSQRPNTFSRHVSHRVETRALDVTDLAIFDFEKYYHDTSARRQPRTSWGDYPAGRRLIRHAKGIGLSMALKDILEGRPRR